MARTLLRVRREFHQARRSSTTIYFGFFECPKRSLGFKVKLRVQHFVKSHLETHTWKSSSASSTASTAIAAKRVFPAGKRDSRIGNPASRQRLDDLFQSMLH